jgi:hypothetical protein
VTAKAASAAARAAAAAAKDPEAAAEQLQAERAAAAIERGGVGRRRLSVGMQLLSAPVRRLSTSAGLMGRRSSLPLIMGKKDSVSGGRSPHATQGIQLLKRGCPAVKISQRGKVRQTAFKLSEDEATLSWEAGGVGGKLSLWPREVLLADVLDVVVGRALNRASHASSQAPPSARLPAAVPELDPSLSISLVLTAVLPPTPSSIRDSARSGAAASTKHGAHREGLDICLEDEETFSLWVAALRTLTTESRKRPVAYPSPYAPLHASAAASLRKGAPADASQSELCRDAVLRALAIYSNSRFFAVVTVVWGLAVVVIGAMFFFLLIGAHGFADQSEADELGNVCIQILTALFTYIISLTLPWRLANVAHLWFSRRSCDAGNDLYGRPTNSIWFHIPRDTRRCVVGLLIANAFFQYATQTCRFVWNSYAASQTPVGAAMINSTFALSILCGMSSGIWQGCAEGKIRKASPDRYPPTPMEFAVRAWKKERVEARRARSQTPGRQKSECPTDALCAMSRRDSEAVEMTIREQQPAMRPKEDIDSADTHVDDARSSRPRHPTMASSSI